MITINGHTQILGLIGDPVAHSLSPAMHNAALAEMRENAVYLPLPVKGEDVGVAIAGFAAIGVKGFNITIPHKQAVIPHLQEISETAKQVGAVNTIYPLANGGWGGTNTDVAGFLHPLRALNHPWQESTALILGSGGAARATIQGCYELGVKEVVVVGRSPQSLAKLTETWTGLITISWSEVDEYLPKALLVTNATPIGMQSETDPEATQKSPLSTEQFQQLPKEAIAYDLIYIPQPTMFLKLAAERGLQTIDGLEMLVQQGAAALSLWLGDREVPVDIMRQSAKASLNLD